MKFVKSLAQVDAALQLPGANAYSSQCEQEMARGAPKIIPELPAAQERVPLFWCAAVDQSSHSRMGTDEADNIFMKERNKQKGIFFLRKMHMLSFLLCVAL